MDRLIEVYEQERMERTLFGFWTYIMSDCVLFSVLFATYIVLHTRTFWGPSPKDLFSAPYALGETLFLLMSSFTCGISRWAARFHRRGHVLLWIGITFLLGGGFLVMEFREFVRLIMAGDSWRRSAFLSAFFTLVGTHGTHVTVGMFWMVVLFFQIFFRGLTVHTLRRLSCFGIFWHFLDIVWVFIFTIVYLFGVM